MPPPPRTRRAARSSPPSFGAPAIRASPRSSRSSPAASADLEPSASVAAQRRGRLHLDDRVPDRDRPVGEDVGVEPGAMGQLSDDPGPRQRLEVGARLAELDAEAFDLADAETPPDQSVETDAAR